MTGSVSLLPLAALSFLLLGSTPVQAETLILTPSGQPRPLQSPVLGASTTVFYERLLEDRAKIAALKTMEIGLDRFPGGSDANFYNWRTGLFDIPIRPDSSAYVRFWGQAAANIASFSSVEGSCWR